LERLPNRLKDGSAEIAAPGAITLELSGIPIGWVHDPTPDSVGRRVFFVARKGADSYELGMGLDLSPDGIPFHVFGESEKTLPAAIARTARILVETNLAVRVEKIAEAMEEETLDLFLKRALARNIAGAAAKNRDSDAGAALRARLLQWRDDTRLNATFRRFVDDRICQSSPSPEYRLSEERRVFLENTRKEYEKEGEERTAELNRNFLIFIDAATNAVPTANGTRNFYQ
jgi:hypothetical protein